MANRSVTSPLRPARVLGRSWLVPFAALALLGSVWVFASPLLASPDEAAHATKAASVVRGQLRGPETVVHQQDERIMNIVRTDVQVPAGFVGLLDDHECMAFYPESPAGCMPPISAATDTATAQTYIGRYPPLYYAAVGWPSLVLSPPRALWGMRLVSVLIAAAIMALGLSMLQLPTAPAPDDDGVTRPRLRVLPVGAALAITPMVLFLAASVNPSALELACAFTAWCGAMVLFDEDQPVRSDVILWTAVAVGVLVLVRPLSPLYAAIIAGTVALASVSRPRIEALWRDRRVQRALVVVVALGVIAAGWILASEALDSFAGNPKVGLSIGERISASVEEYPYRVRQMIGVFGWLDTPLPPAVIAGWLALVAAVVVAAFVVGGRRARLALAALLATVIVLPIAAEVQAVPEVGFVWQGRYTLPLAMGLPLVAAWVLDRWWIATPSERVDARARTLRIAAGVVIAYVALAQLLSLVTSARRYAVGLSQPMFEHLTRAEWSPKPGHLGLLLLSGAACAAYAVMWWVTTTRPGVARPPASNAVTGPE